MAFFLEERDTKFLIDNQTPNIGPGQYKTPGAFKLLNKNQDEDNDQKGAKFVKVKRPGFNQSTKRDNLYQTNYNPAPGLYNSNYHDFKSNYVTNQMQQNSEKGVYYVIENGNLQKKQQSYAADRLHRFNYANISQVGAEVGPGSYELTSQVGASNAIKEAYKKQQPSYIQNKEEAPLNKIKKKLIQHVGHLSKVAHSVPSIPAGNKILFPNEEEFNEETYNQALKQIQAIQEQLRDVTDSPTLHHNFQQSHNNNTNHKNNGQITGKAANKSIDIKVQQPHTFTQQQQPKHVRQNSQEPTPDMTIQGNHTGSLMNTQNANSHRKTGGSSLGVTQGKSKEGFKIEKQGMKAGAHKKQEPIYQSQLSNRVGELNHTGSKGQHDSVQTLMLKNENNQPKHFNNNPPTEQTTNTNLNNILQVQTEEGNHPLSDDNNLINGEIMQLNDLHDQDLQEINGMNFNHHQQNTHEQQYENAEKDNDYVAKNIPNLMQYYSDKTHTHSQLHEPLSMSSANRRDNSNGSAGNNFGTMTDVNGVELPQLFSKTQNMSEFKGFNKGDDGQHQGDHDNQRISQGGVGPGQYNPNMKSVKKATPAYNWGISRTKRTPANANPRQLMSAGIPLKLNDSEDPNSQQPGPGAYDQDALTLHKTVQQKASNGVNQEQLNEMRISNYNHFKAIKQKMNLDNKAVQMDKIKKHQEMKQDMDSRVGPGAYYNNRIHSEFKKELKPEYLQFFGSTQERFKHTNKSLVQPHQEIGPATYDVPQSAPITTSLGGYHRKAETAAFKSQRKDMLFSGNDLPGPGQYSHANRDETFGSGLVNGRASTSGNWHTNIGAFGSTEKRFAQICKQQSHNLNNSSIQFDMNGNLTGTSQMQNNLGGSVSTIPGPGDYELQSQFGGAVKYITRKIRGKNIRMRSEMPHSAVFKSQTGRSLDQNLSYHIKQQSPADGQYNSSQGLAHSFIQGGAPNNFLLMKNEKRQAPFQSTVNRFKSVDSNLTQSKSTSIILLLPIYLIIPQHMLFIQGIGHGACMSTQDSHNISKSTDRQTFYNKNRASFGMADRFSDQQKQKNFRIGPKIMGPGPTSYTQDNGFNKKSFNLRFLQQ
eukprot:403344779